MGMPSHAAVVQCIIIKSQCIAASLRRVRSFYTIRIPSEAPQSEDLWGTAHRP